MDMYRTTGIVLRAVIPDAVTPDEDHVFVHYDSPTPQDVKWTKQLARAKTFKSRKAANDWVGMAWRSDDPKVPVHPRVALLGDAVAVEEA